ncbi:MAG: hypothetical protein OXR67_17650 [Chloroflexota bacterium]|nr:hypothetical protein [Chloroflexota bacterium]
MPGSSVVFGHFGAWEEARDRAWQSRATDPLHQASDLGRSIAGD